ncbi:MAG: M13 family metallopeptidase [Terriglobales bacterium]
MHLLKSIAVVLVCAGIALAQNAAAPAAIPGFDIKALDRNVDPCVDFYRFACGTWMANNPIPPDQSRWGRFNELAERNRYVLREILENAAGPHANRSANEQKIGDFYASCMDEKTVNQLGAQPIEPELKRIAEVKDRTGLMDAVAHLHARGTRALFAFHPMADLHDAANMVANVDQGGLTLPDRDYYTRTDAKSVETRDKYVAHVQRMFELLGDKPEVAAAEAKTVLAVETELAKASMDRVARRDPRNRDHKMTTEELAKLAANFQFARYFAAVDAPKMTALNVGNPEFFKAVNAALETIPLADWKTYLRWHLLRASANLLSDAFVNQQFEFDGKYLSGAKELQPRWKRCTQMTDRLLGEALGELYVQKAFGGDAKQRTRQMVRDIFAAMSKDIDALDWMSPATKKAAHEKLSQVADNIGYPDKWRDYSKVKIVRGDLVGNAERAGAFEFARQVGKVGKPVDRKEWSMTPPTVNAYYSPSRNDINFPAGILQPPFYDNTLDDAVNFGGIGSVIGHELTHGFDDQGAKFDPVGNLRDWWIKEDFAEFQKRGQCLVDEYSNFVAVEDVRLNGKLTLGENTADNGGVRLSFMALQERLKDKPVGLIDGFTPEKRFFLGYAQIWCQNVTPQNARLLAQTDPHSPGQYRVNGVVANMPEFHKAFNCKPGQPMVRENACRTW